MLRRTFVLIVVLPCLALLAAVYVVLMRSVPLPFIILDGCQPRDVVRLDYILAHHNEFQAKTVCTEGYLFTWFEGATLSTNVRPASWWIHPSRVQPVLSGKSIEARFDTKQLKLKCYGRDEFMKSCYARVRLSAQFFFDQPVDPLMEPLPSPNFVRHSSRMDPPQH